MTEFAKLLEKVRSVWERRERQQLSSLDRQHAVRGRQEIGAGIARAVIVASGVVTALPDHISMGYLFGIDKSTVSQYTRRMLTALQEVRETTLGWSETPHRLLCMIGDFPPVGGSE